MINVNQQLQLLIGYTTDAQKVTEMKLSVNINYKYEKTSAQYGTGF
jgi:hypothetical protein